MKPAQAGTSNPQLPPGEWKGPRSSDEQKQGFRTTVSPFLRKHLARLELQSLEENREQLKGERALSPPLANPSSSAENASSENGLLAGMCVEDLDYMHARYCSPVQGRFLSIDPVLKMRQAMRRPQRWNRYAYVTNNPLKWTDPTGEFIQLPDNCVDNDCEELTALQRIFDQFGQDVELRVDENGVVEAVGEDVNFLDARDDPVAGLRSLINDKKNGVDFAFTGEDLSAFGGARTRPTSETMLEVRINRQQVQETIFPGEGLSGFFTGKPVGGIGTPGPALVHEVGHAAAFFAGFPYPDRRATSDEWAVRYENFHRSMLRGPENFRRLFH